MKPTEQASNTATLSFPLGNKTFTVTRKRWKVADLKLDPANPRLGYLLRINKKGQPATDKELHDMLWDMDQVKDLYQSIFQNGGLLEDPIIYDSGVVVEGNCRIVCMRELCNKFQKDDRFKYIYVRVLPSDVTEEQLMLLLGELHIAGKIEWRAYDQAEYVWRMNKQFGRNYDYLASHLRWSRSKLSQKIAAYEDTKAYMDRTGDPDGINRFSHFEEFMKKKELRERRDSDPKFMKQFGDWVLKGKFPNAVDVRNLPEILANPDALKTMEKEGIRQAQQVIFQTNPSLASNLYSSIDEAAQQLENASLSEITALQNGDKIRLEKIKRLLVAIRKVEKFAGIELDKISAKGFCMSEDLVISKIKKNAVSEVWVVAREYEGKPACDVREYFRPADKPDWLPTKKGVSIPPELVGQSVDAVEQMLNKTTVCEVAVLPRGKKVKLRFGICEYNKCIYADLRMYYIEKSDSEEWKPGKGVTLPLSMLTNLVEALRLAEDHFEK